MSTNLLCTSSIFLPDLFAKFPEDFIDRVKKDFGVYSHQVTVEDKV